MDTLILWVSVAAMAWGLIKGPIFNPNHYIDYETLERKNQGMLILTAMVCALGSVGIFVVSTGIIPHAR